MKKFIRCVLIVLLLSGCAAVGYMEFIDSRLEDEPIFTPDMAREILSDQYAFTEAELEGLDAYAFVKECHINTNDWDQETVRYFYDRYKDDYVDSGYSENFYIFDIVSSADLEESDTVAKIALDYAYGTGDEKILLDFTSDTCYYNFYYDTIGQKPLEDTPLKDDIYEVCKWKHQLSRPVPGTTDSAGYTIVIETTDGKFCTYTGWVQNEKFFQKGYSDIYEEAHEIINWSMICDEKK